jgi:Icc protein
VESISFIHLTDTHFPPRPSERIEDIDPVSNLHRVLARVRELAVRPAFLLISGDLSNAGDPESYRHFKVALDELREEFGVPVLLGLGNHDRRGPFRQIILGEALADDEGARYFYSARIGDFRILMLDSLIPGAIHGALGLEQLAWLDEQLREPAPGGDLVVLHHPVLPRGIPRAADYLLEDAAALRDVLQGRPILGVLAGHSHVSSAAPFAGTLAITAPAAGFLFDPGTVDGLRILDGAGFNLCTVRDGLLIVNPIVVSR